MILYKYTNSAKFLKIPGYKYLSLDNYVNRYLNGAIIFSTTKPYKMQQKYYVQSIFDNYYYCITHPVTLKNIFTESVLIDSNVVADTKAGLRLYKDFQSDDILSKLNIDSKIFIGMDFRIDQKNNIWTSGTVFIDNNHYINGYIIYKNTHNNFANVRINHPNYTTVLLITLK